MNTKTNQEVLKVLGRSIRQAPEFRGNQPLPAEIERSMQLLQHSESVNVDARAADRQDRNSGEAVSSQFQEYEPSD